MPRNIRGYRIKETADIEADAEVESASVLFDGERAFFKAVGKVILPVLLGVALLIAYDASPKAKCLVYRTLNESDAQAKDRALDLAVEENNFAAAMFLLNTCADPNYYYISTDDNLMRALLRAHR